MSKDDKQIDTSAKKEEPKKDKKDETMKDDKGRPLTEADIKMITRYGKGPYTETLKRTEDDIKNYNSKITALCGVKESDTGLALPSQWNTQADQ